MRAYSKRERERVRVMRAYSKRGVPTDQTSAQDFSRKSRGDDRSESIRVTDGFHERERENELSAPRIRVYPSHRRISPADGLNYFEWSKCILADGLTCF